MAWLRDSRVITADADNLAAILPQGCGCEVEAG